MTEDKVIGIAWYYREQWDKLRAHSKDRTSMEKQYDDWEKKALEAVAKMEAERVRVHRVYIDVDMLIAWCKKKRLVIDGYARSEYTNHLLANHFGMNKDI